MGLFRSQDTPRSGFRRATFGTLLIIGGIVTGAFVGVPRLHQSLTASHTPVPLDCIELLREGLPEHSSMVVLRDAQVHPPGELGFDAPGPAPPSMAAKVQSVLANRRAAPLLDRLVRGDVLPRGMLKRSGRQPLRLSQGRETAKVASEEIEQTGTLKVHVSEDPTWKLVCTTADYLKLPVPQSVKQSAEIPHFSLHPASLIGTSREASVWVLGGGCSLALGLILCGSSSLGWWVLLSPLAAVLGLPGVWLRNGRGNRLTWMVSFALGVVCLAAGYHLAITMGRFAQAGGVWLWQAAGLIALAGGVAAILGTMLSIRGARSNSSSHAHANMASVERGKRTAKKHSQRRKGADEEPDTMFEPRPEALLSKIGTSDYTRRYVDPQLHVSPNMEPPSDVQIQTASLERLQFDSPLIIEIGRGEGTIEATVQIGCQNLVLALTDHLNGHLRLRTVSFLADGHVVLSGNGQDDRLAKPIQGDASSLQVFDVSAAPKLVAGHLQTAAQIAERRHTKLMTLEPNEWRDLVHYSERCMANTLHQAHVEKWEITDAQYGRFAFPPREVAAPVLV